MLDLSLSDAEYVPQSRMHLWWLGVPSSPVLIGDINLVEGGRGVSLKYSDTWLRSGFALSEDLPLLPQTFMPHAKDTAAGAVDDARPDRWGERLIRVLDKPKRLSLLEYLYFSGDDRFGALGVSLRSDIYLPRTRSVLPTLADVGQVHAIVRKVIAGEPVDERERRLVSPGRSMGGAKPKSLVTIDAAQWVLKFADAYDHDWPLIEHAVMRLGSRCGIAMCETRAIHLGPGRSAIAIRRFDRRTEGLVELRSHCLSAGVALVAAGEELGYPELAGVLRRLSPAEQSATLRHELFRRMVFNILCDNTDDHERNHSLVLGPGGYALSPAYDVVPAMQNLGYQALRVGAAQMDSTLDNAMSSAGAFGLTRNAAAAVITDICATLGGWQGSLIADGVSDRDIQALEPFLDGEKLAMRTEFMRSSKP